MPLISQLNVALGDRSYPIVIGYEILGDLGKWLSDQHLLRGPHVAVISNPTVAEHYGVSIRSALYQGGFRLSGAEMPDGEAFKTPETVVSLCRQLVAGGIERHSTVLALGGGVVGDVAGFVAACCLRGLDYVQVPTTLLAMVDSSVGGKTGVDLPEGKNLMGAFHQPRLVWMDVATLRTLDFRQISAGMAEVIKYGVIRDAAFFERLEGYTNYWSLPGGMPRFVSNHVDELAGLVAHCCQIKADIVALDECESGLRAILNFGHTIGHAIEVVTGYDRFLHGEAVAIGMLAETRVACRMGRCGAEVLERQQSLLQAAGLPLTAPELDETALVSAMLRDKKVVDGKIRMILPTHIGAVEQIDQVDPQLAVSVLNEMRD